MTGGNDVELETCNHYMVKRKLPCVKTINTLDRAMLKYMHEKS